ncbi:MAG: NAD(P)/FAD-dependent oxidoreductase [Alphaproteobacteria bacterium]
MTPQEVEVLIVGGGVAGCAAALHLARRGARVTVLEKGAAGAQASGVNFGGVRRNGRHVVELPLANRARALWPRLGEIIGADCEFAATGHVKLGMNDADMAELEAYARTAKNHGLEIEILGRGGLRQRWPWLGETVAGGAFCADDGCANPRLVGPAYARAARAAGAEIRENCEAIDLAHDGSRFTVRGRDGLEHRAATLINAAGAWGGRLAARFGEPVPIEAIAPQMAVTEPAPYFIAPVLGMCGAGIYLRQIPRGNVIFGGGDGDADLDIGRASVRPENTVATGALAVRLIPRLAGVHIIRVWSGVEGRMPDDLPVIGPSRTTPGLIHAFGFSGHGFQLGPAMGEVLAELALDGATPTPIDAFDIGRFAAPQ